MKKLLTILLFVSSLFAQNGVAPLPQSKPQFFTRTGSVCSGCKLYSFVTGTGVPLQTYTDSSGTVQNQNPITMGSDGRPPQEIWLGAFAYDLTLRDSFNVVIYTVKNISVPNIQALTQASLTVTGPVIIAPSNPGIVSSSSVLEWDATYSNGTSIATDKFQCSNIPAAGNNPATVLTCNHSGSSGGGSVFFNFPFVSINTGSLTNSGNETVSGTLTAKILEKRCDANLYTGADWSIQLVAAIADSNCSIIDGSNLSFASSSSVSVVINNNKQVTLPCATITGGASVNPVFQVNNFGGLIGRDRHCTIISTNSGTANIIAVANGVNWGRISDLTIQSAVARTAGSGIRGQGGHYTIERLVINPVFDGISFDTASVSGNNTVRDVEFTDLTGAPGPGLGAAWHCGVKVGGVAVGTVSGNVIDNAIFTTSTAAFSDAAYCIQDGSDTTKIIGGQVAWGGTDSVGIHLETVNGGAAPNQTQISTWTCEAGATKNCVVHDQGLNTSITGTTLQSSLRGMIINGGSDITLTGNTFQLNQQEGLRITTTANVVATGNIFSESSQQTTNTFSDIFVAANVSQFALTGNIHKDQFATGKICKDGIEIAAGGSDFYSIFGDINNGNCGTLSVSDGGTGGHRISCNPGLACINGIGSSGFVGEFVSALSSTSGAYLFGSGGSVFLDYGATTPGKFTFTGGNVIGTFAFQSGTAPMTTALIAAGACGTTVTVAATGVTTSDTINTSRSTAATNANGGNLSLNAWPTAGNVNFNYCNQSAAGVTPGAMTINWSVSR